ncbi:cytochrome c oxidase subunit 2 [Rhodoblastus acidophilus]|uniref:cytochrome c oxidase subunit II n=1 Tax=Rhodoblastus acidophilus TaxID=1074 RepID=UPI0022251C9C|nr:cytochrome c oxidase subunit II [Rhodoblastus acidophilus]MCW2283990.1 cytochrome c oxidase subunit 2 [Rhodoblastus acidophilus]MCW2332686.1 cytochrome c oxidase subunit 2 [Rhodoblastus acidophilus]
MRSRAAIPALLALSGSAQAANRPLDYLKPGGGLIAREIWPLLWGLLGVGIVVVVLISALVLVGALRRRGEAAGAGLIETHASRWIGIGVGVSTVVLFGLVGWSTAITARIATPPTPSAFTVEVRAHQWWWEFTYLNDNPQKVFTTANEMHLPVGRPVRFLLKSDDVIHSCWVPTLSGKTDVIPGQNNVAWLQAERPGTYRGQCSEYCGKQHAHMAFAIVADPPELFERWRARQLRPAPATSGEAAQGAQVFGMRCGICHRVRGGLAQGRLGPDLTHVTSRQTIAAATLPNDPAHLSAWIASPQHFKPGAYMPDLGLSGQELSEIRSYLTTLE